ncbi:MAG: YbaN family protein [Burkholderiales bacterium]
MTPQDYSHETAVHPSRAVRVALVVAGIAFVGLGILGAFLPVLPTTPFMLLAAACFARASTRFYNALLNNRAFGPTILEWRRHRSIPYRTKWTAIALMAATLAASIVFAVEDRRVQAALAVFGVLLAIWMARIPSRDRPSGRT